MREEDVLIGITQLGSVFAGLISIFMVFARADGRFSPSDGIKVRAILHTSFSVVFAALAPLGLAAVDVPEPSLWRISAAIYILMGTAISIDILRHRKSVTAESGAEPITPRIISWALVTTMMALSLLIIAGYLGGGYYLVTLILGLGIGSATFISFALQRLL